MPWGELAIMSAFLTSLGTTTRQSANIDPLRKSNFFLSTIKKSYLIKRVINANVKFVRDAIVRRSKLTDSFVIVCYVVRVFVFFMARVSPK